MAGAGMSGWPVRRRLRTPGRASRRRTLAVAGALLAFVAVLAARTRPVSPVLRAPRQYELAALIDRQQADIATLRHELTGLQHSLDRLRTADLGSQKGRVALEAAVADAAAEAGTVAVRGPAVQVVLDDSTRANAPNVNDLVIHSQDVQAVVNALWRSGAEAVAVNGQRVVSTSAVECVGNTLLLDGSVYSPPYVVVGVGADRSRFEADGLVRELAVEAATYGLQLDVSAVGSATAPAYSGRVAPRYATAAGPASR